MKHAVGVCAQCGGVLTVPTVSWSVFPPTPSCDSCGGANKRAHAPAAMFVAGQVLKSPPTYVGAYA